MTNDQANLLMARAAAITMRWNFRMWGFGEAIALRGLLEAGARTGDRAIEGFVHGLMRGWIGRGVAASPEDHVGPGRELISIWQLYGDEAFLDAARALARLNEGFTQGPFGARCHRPDTPGWRRQIWVDCMDVDGPFLVALGQATGDARYFDQAAEEVLGYARTLQDASSGLLRHGFETAAGCNGAYWARGNGWALMGLADTLKALPENHSGYREIVQRLDLLLSGLTPLQTHTGLWRTIVTDSESYEETTLAAMVACTLPDAIRRGHIDPKYGEAGQRARDAVLAQVNENGALGRVSEATPVGEPQIYNTREFGVYPWGQGPLLLMLARSPE